MLNIINPATEEVIARITDDTASSVAEKYQCARKAQFSWAATPLSQRLNCIRKFTEIIAERKNSLAQTLTAEVGKPIKQSHNELSGLLNRVNFFLAKTERTLADELVYNSSADKLEERISHEPLGVIANISAWNFPYFVGSNVFIPGLLAGNTVLYKPSEYATLTGIEISKALHDAGIPQDAFIPIIGRGDVGSELLKQPLNGVFFTGSYATGCKIASQVAGRLIKLQLELGGKDPVYVCDDADPVASAQSLADGAMYNAGQSCCSVERIYVHEKIYTPFIDAFIETVKGFVLGSPEDENTYLGPLTRGEQRDVLMRQIKDAKGKGATLLCGGNPVSSRKGYYFEPTVLTNVNHSMEIMREESFGPIIGIQKVCDDEEALKLMNDTEYGLTAGVFTPDKKRACSLLAQVNTGSVYWNACDRVSPNLPWSGRGHSGIGLTLSTHGIIAFTQPKAWHLRG